MLNKKLLKYVSIFREKFIIPFGFTFFFISVILYILSFVYADFILPIIIPTLGLFFGYVALINWLDFQKERIQIVDILFKTSVYILTGSLVLIFSEAIPYLKISFPHWLQVLLFASSLVSGVLIFSIKLKSIQGLENIDSENFCTSNTFYFLIFLIVLAAGFFVRIYHLGDLSLWWDELLTGTYVTRILDIWIPLSPSGFEYYWRGIPYHYLVSAFALLFDKTEFWLRFPSVLFGTGIVAMSYIITRRISTEFAVAVAILIAFSTFNIEYSQFARFYVMNTFLFILNIELFWRGFFENRKKYKIASVLVFFIMLLTTKLGGVFLAAVIYWILYQFYLLYTKKIIAKNLFIREILVVTIMFLGIYFVNNPFNFIDIYTNVPYATVFINESIDGGVEYLFNGIPKIQMNNIVLPFYNDFYWPAIFPILSFIFLLHLLVQKIRKRLEFGYNEYILSVFAISLVLFELANPFSREPRLYLIFEPMYVIYSLLLFLILLRMTLKSTKIRNVLLFSVTAILLSIPSPFFIERINIKYGDDVSSDPFRTTWAQSYRSDSSGTLNYLKEHISKDDIWISTMQPGYMYYQNNPDFIINQNYKWKSMWRDREFIDENGNYIDIRFGGILINQVKQLENLMEKNLNKNIWLVVSGQNLNTLYTTHLNENFEEFLKIKDSQVVYRSPDGISRVLFFPKKR